MLSFKPAFSLSSFTFIKRLFSSSLLSALRVMSSAYLGIAVSPGSLDSSLCFIQPGISHHVLSILGFTGALVVNNLAANAGNVRDMGLLPGSGRFPEGGHDNTLQFSCWRIPMDRGAWQISVHRVAQSWTQLKQLNTHSAYKLSKQGDSTALMYSFPSFDSHFVIPCPVLTVASWRAYRFLRRSTELYDLGLASLLRCLQCPEQCPIPSGSPSFQWWWKGRRILPKDKWCLSPQSLARRSILRPLGGEFSTRFSCSKSETSLSRFIPFHNLVQRRPSGGMGFKLLLGLSILRAWLSISEMPVRVWQAEDLTVPPTLGAELRGQSVGTAMR